MTKAPAEALVLLTGASRGIGLAIARAVPFPARIVDLSRSGPPPDSAIEHISADLGDPAAWIEVGAAIRRMVQVQDVSQTFFVHAAGTLVPIGFAGEVADDEYQSNVLLNSAAGQVLGHFYLDAVRTVAGDHHLIMLTSGAARTAYAGWAAYGAGKAALDHWVRTVGEEQKVRGNVTVAAIAPGVVDTAMQDLIRSTDETDFPAVVRFRELYSGDVLADPDDVAARFWRIVTAGVDTGSVLDLRDL